MHDSTFNDEYRQAFVLQEEDVKKLFRLLKDRIGDVEIATKCADKIDRAYAGTDDLFKFENTTAKAILGMSFIARTFDPPKTAHIDFTGRGISLRLTGSEDFLVRTKSSVLDILDGTKPWWSGIQRLDFHVVFFFGFVMLFVAALGWLGFVYTPPSNPVQPAQPPTGNSAKETAKAVVVTFGVFGGLVVVGGLLNKLRNRFFPDASFLIGQAKGRHKTIEYIQWAVIIGFFVSLGAGIVTLWF